MEMISRLSVNKSDISLAAMIAEAGSSPVQKPNTCTGFRAVPSIAGSFSA